MNTFLAPIERPTGLMMKLVYHFTRKQFGKVLTPLKVHTVRLPAAFGMFYGKISSLDKRLKLSPETTLLIRQRVAQLNTCLFCIDISRAVAIRELLIPEEKIDALDEYQSSKHFNPSERAALDYVSELTRDKCVKPDTFGILSKYYSEREICELVYIAASEHLYNLTNIGLNIHSDMICDITKAKRSVKN